MSHMISLPFEATCDRAPVTVIDFLACGTEPMAIVVFGSGQLGYVEVTHLKIPKTDEPPATTA